MDRHKRGWNGLAIWVEGTAVPARESALLSEARSVVQEDFWTRFTSLLP
jgi:hypothetical protein